jgi:hypothetical protein
MPQKIGVWQARLSPGWRFETFDAGVAANRNGAQASWRARLRQRTMCKNPHRHTRLMIRHGVGCRIEETLHIKKVDEEFFE